MLGPVGINHARACS